MFRFAAWCCVLVACGRLHFEPVDRDARGDSVAGFGDGIGNDVGTTCDFVSAGCGDDQILCCGATSQCQPYTKPCSGTIGTCDVVTHAGCDTASGALCCVTMGPARCMNPPTC